MINLRSHYPIGIDIGDQYIHAVQLRANGDDIAIRGLWRREFEAFSDGLPDEDEALVSVLKGIPRSKRFQGRSAVIHLPNQVVHDVTIQFEKSKEESVEEGIFRETGRHLTFPIEEAILDYPSISERTSGGKTEYTATVVAARRDYVQRYGSMVHRAGLTLDAVDSGVSSLIRLHDLHTDACQDTKILCFVGYRQSLLVVVIRDYILAQRPFTWGFQTLLDKIRANLELPADKAMFLMNKYGLGYEDLRGGAAPEEAGSDEVLLNLHRVLYQIITPYIDELIYEFHTITSYVRSEERHSEFGGIAMYGCANMMHFLDSYLEKRIDIPVEVFNPVSGMEKAEDVAPLGLTEGAPFGLAVGLATRKVSWL